MKCKMEGCRGSLKVTHTYDVDGESRTQRMVCKSCKKAHTAVTMLHDGDGRGNGAKAVADKLRAKAQ